MRVRVFTNAQFAAHIRHSLHSNTWTHIYNINTWEVSVGAGLVGGKGSKAFKHNKGQSVESIGIFVGICFWF